MRIVSLVPSWTETLIAAGLDVVGRTRFCIHPDEAVKKIPAVGGTKSADWKAIAALKPDLVIMDREENTKEMAEECKHPLWVSHVESIGDVAKELERLSEEVESQYLMELSKRWREFEPRKVSVEQLPVLEWLQKPSGSEKQILYVIWKDPWMVVSKETFIGSILGHLGFESYLREFPRKYPEVLLEEYSRDDTLVLFSSEPYPFHKKTEELKQLGFAAAIVDGEAYSWFGLRSLEKLGTTE